MISLAPMADDAGTLGFGMTYGMVAVRTACDQLVSLSHSNSEDRVPPHKHINDYVCIVVAGGFAEHAGNNWHDRPAGSYFVHRAGETHHDEFGSAGATCLSLHFDDFAGAASRGSMFEIGQSSRLTSWLSSWRRT